MWVGGGYWLLICKWLRAQSACIYIIVIRAQCGVYEIYKPEGPGCSARARRGRY